MPVSPKDGKFYTRCNVLNPNNTAHYICLCGERRRVECVIRECCSLESYGQCHHVQIRCPEPTRKLEEEVIRKDERTKILAKVGELLPMDKDSRDWNILEALLKVTADEDNAMQKQI